MGGISAMGKLSLSEAFYTVPSSSSSTLSVLLRLFVSSSITAAALMLYFIRSFSPDIGPPLLKMKRMTVASCAGGKYALVPVERHDWQVLSKIGYVVKSFSVATAFVCRITWILFRVHSSERVCVSSGSPRGDALRGDGVSAPLNLGTSLSTCY